MRFPLRISVVLFLLNSLFASSKVQAQASDGREILVPILMELALHPDFIPNLFDAFPIRSSNDLSNQVSELNLDLSPQEETRTILNSFVDNLSDEQENDLWLNFFQNIILPKKEKKKNKTRIQKMNSESSIDSGSEGRGSPLYRTRSDRKLKKPTISIKLAKKIEEFKKNPRTLKILIADDNALNLLALRAKITQLRKILGIEIEIVSVSDGQEAYRELEEAYLAHRPFDLALLDRNMSPIENSELNGDIATERWRTFELTTPASENLHIPIFTISTSNSEESKDLCLKRGMDLFLEKDVSPLDILNHMLDFI